MYLVAVGTHGDILPVIALGAALTKRGVPVSLAAPAPFGPLAARAGLTCHPLGTHGDFDDAVNAASLWHPIRGARSLFAVVARAAEPTYRWLEENCRPGVDVVVASTLALGARVAQDRLGLSLVTLHLMPMLIESRLAPPRLPGLPLPELLPARWRHWLGRGADDFVIGPAVLPRLNAFRQSLSLPPVKRLRHWWHSPQRILLATPGWYASPQPDWPVQLVQVGFPFADLYGDTDRLAPDLTAFLEAGAPPLVFTYGSAMGLAHGFFRTAVGICRQLGMRGILLTSRVEQIPSDLPDGIYHAPYAPLSQLLPRCAALVHHGGIGTVAQALAAGCPQLIVPVAFNHADEARRVARLGVGAALSRRRFTRRRAGRVLGRLLTSESVTAACAEARARIARENGIETACDAVERMLA
ncbi:glycosyl transferase family 28 [Methylobacterium nodulans ORS 2060]|uniref:Glycosyl transferase family 28 n=1 Tax=Methylobacterium nodulans (strain LMG 21967 / CNCM I-2342 / ORS 2060) TaxID=460265 RepID=B8IG75_METNO|nr:glycosyl transferase family 28 [Methylobacterium nodulans ORS 2060]